MNLFPNTLELKAKLFLEDYLKKNNTITEQSIKEIVELFELATYKKNEIIISEGKISDEFYFIYKGAIRVFFYKDDKLIIDRFEVEGGSFGSNFSFLTKKPCTYNYEAMEDVVLLKGSYKALDELCKKSHEIERLYRMNMEMYHFLFTQRMSAFKSTTTEDRYNNFIEEYGDLANRIPLKDIANYLDMSPETLSRIRANKLDKNQKL